MYDTIVPDEVIAKTIESLRINGMEASVVNTAAEAREKLLSMIPEGASVMNMTSITLDEIGVVDDILHSGKFKPARSVLTDPQASINDKLVAGSGSDYTIGSVHAVTQDGKVMVASNTGSQLPAYAYTSPHVIWVVGAQKIARDLDDGFKRIYDYVLPKESVRANKAYNITHGSFVSKLLIFNREINKDRIKIIFVKEPLGF